MKISYILLNKEFLNALAIFPAIYQNYMEVWDFSEYFWCILGLWCTFFSIFFYENCPYIIIYQLTEFHYQTFSTFQDIKQFVFEFLFRNMMTLRNFRIYLQAASPVNSAMIDRWKKVEKRKMQNLNISTTKRAFSVNKNHFHIF